MCMDVWLPIDTYSPVKERSSPSRKADLVVAAALVIIEVHCPPGLRRKRPILTSPSSLKHLTRQMANTPSNPGDRGGHLGRGAQGDHNLPAVLPLDGPSRVPAADVRDGSWLPDFSFRSCSSSFSSTALVSLLVSQHGPQWSSRKKTARLVHRMLPLISVRCLFGATRPFKL